MRMHSLWIVTASTAALLIVAGCAQSQSQPRVQVNAQPDPLEIRLAKAQSELEAAKGELRHAIAEAAIMQQAVERYAQRNAKADENREAIRRAIEPVTNSKSGGKLSPAMRKQLAAQIRELAELEAQREKVKQVVESVARDPEAPQDSNRQMQRLTQKIVRLKAEIRRLEGLVQQEGRGD